MTGEQLFRSGECPNCHHEILRAAKAEWQLTALQAENDKLRECVELYADIENWTGANATYKAPKVLWIAGNTGPEPAQKCLQKITGLKN